jgi:hypothetical protein
VQRYGEILIHRIAHTGYSAYHKYGISPFFPLIPILLLGKMMQKTVKHLVISRKSATFVNRKFKTKKYDRRKRNFKEE